MTTVVERSAALPRPASVLAPERLRAEQHEVGDVLGLGRPAPRLSWTVPAAPQRWRQAAYAVRVRREAGAEEDVAVASADQVLVPWPVAPLTSRERVVVAVRVQGDDGGWSPWSEPLVLEAGLLEPADWRASVVGPDGPEERGPDGLRRPPLLRRRFTLDAPPVRARLHLTAHGLVEAELNGARVGRDELVPGWTVYPHRLRAFTYDVTEALVAGENVLGAWLGDGWYRGKVGFDGGVTDLYGDRLGLVAQLEVTAADGTVTTVVSDDAWRSTPSPVLSAGLLEGEVHDARAVPAGWSRPGFDDAGWRPVAVTPLDAAVLVAPTGPPVRCTDELLPVEVRTVAEGTQLLDFGQNAAGRLRLRLHGAEPGTRIVLRHAEVLQDGRLCTRPLRGAPSVDTYVCAGGEEEWEPRFTVHGFRYAEVTGWPGVVAPGDVVLRVLRTDYEEIGDFSCSDPLVERLHQNVRWSMRSNFVDLPTDCPQRDERLGWTGDIAAFAPTAAFLGGVGGMLDSWLQDLALEQERVGLVPPYVPMVALHFWKDAGPLALWGDAAVIVPWVLHERTGDVGVLARQYPSARAWVEQVQGLLGPDGLWDTGRQLGDWLDPTAPPERPMEAQTDPYLVANAFAVQSLRWTSAMARVLGHAADEARYGDRAAAMTAAFRSRWVRPGGRMTSDTQTAYALAIGLDLLDAADRAAAGDRLAELVDAAEGRVASGFAGIPYVAPALTATGHTAQAYRMLLQTQCPSWLYQVLSGGTTTWERWDSLLPDGTVNPGDMTSFNHYALGAVADWMHGTVAGLAAAAPGYRRVRVAPRPGGGLTSAAARHVGPYGEVAVAWRREGDRLHVDVTVPVGSTALVDLPGQEPRELGHGRHALEAAWVDA